jgi:hypothetical protein
MVVERLRCDRFRAHARLHTALAPYLYRYAVIAHGRGLPLVRPLFLNYPDDAATYGVEDQYLLGDDLLVAPVDDEGARTRTLYLPAGGWVDFWTGAIFDGGREVTADAPLDRIPVYVRAGAIIPMAADFDTLVPAAEPGVRTWNGDLVIRAMPSNGPVGSSFRLYDGTELAYRTDGRGAILSVRWSPSPRGLEIHLPAEAPPAAVRIGDSAAADWRYDAANREVVVSTHAADTTVSVEP